MNLNDPDQFLAVAAASRPAHTAEIRCSLLLKEMKQHAVGVFGDGGEAFYDVMAQSLWDGEFHGLGGDEVIAGLMREYAEYPGLRLPTDYFHLCVAMAYAFKAIHIWREHRDAEAWDLAFDAAQHSGVLAGYLLAASTEEKPTDKDWTLIKPKRADTLNLVLYGALKAAKDAGHQRPVFRQIMNQWMLQKPPQFANVMPSEIALLDEDGEMKTVKVEAVEDRYKRMTAQKKGR